MKKSTRFFWICALVQVFVVVVLLTWHFYVWTKGYIAHPTDGDMYAHTWSFQTMVFCIFQLLPAFVVLGVLFTLEWFALCFILNRRQHTNEKPSA
jgi:hypothetical protein